jgi:very-short-patch-repair endonuclease
MLRYDPNLIKFSRHLRKNLTDSESVPWLRLRRKQIAAVQFYRQKPIGKFIVDFYAPSVQLMVEVDGSQHKDGDHFQRDQERDEYLDGLGLMVLRFNSSEVLTETEAVVQVIFRTITERLSAKISPTALCQTER